MGSKKLTFDQVVCSPFQPNLDRADIEPIAALKSSNLNRAAYRAKCRQKLADHMCMIQTFDTKKRAVNIVKGTKLEISIEPAEVRLIPSAQDLYTWRHTSRETTPPRQASKQAPTCNRRSMALLRPCADRQGITRCTPRRLSVEHRNTGTPGVPVFLSS